MPRPPGQKVAQAPLDEVHEEMFAFLVTATRETTGFPNLSESEVLRKLIRDKATELGFKARTTTRASRSGETPKRGKGKGSG